MSRNDECKKIQNLILEEFLRTNSLEGNSTEILDHIKSCKRCQIYLDGLSITKKLYTNEKLYTDKLRAKTLRAIAKAKKENIPETPWTLLTLFSIAAIVFSLCLPIFVIHKILFSLNLTVQQSILVSVFIYFSIGMVTNIYFFIAMKEKFFSKKKKFVTLEG